MKKPAPSRFIKFRTGSGHTVYVRADSILAVKSTLQGPILFFPGAFYAGVVGDAEEIARRLGWVDTSLFDSGGEAGDNPLIARN